MGMVASALDLKYCREMNAGMTLFDQPLRNPRTGAAPLTAAVARFVTAILPTVGGTQKFTIVAQPDMCRNPTMTLVDAGLLVQKIRAKIRGLDFWGNSVITYLVATAPGTVSGTIALKQIDEITAITSGAPAAGVTVSFGMGNGLGIPVRIGDILDVKYKREAATQDTTGVITIGEGGNAIWTPPAASVPDNTRTYFCTVLSTLKF